MSEFNGLFEIVDEILSTLTPDTIARIFWNWIERSTQVINTNRDYVWCPTQWMQKHFSQETPDRLG
jgi:hypothetical protein